MNWSPNAQFSIIIRTFYFITLFALFSQVLRRKKTSIACFNRIKFQFSPQTAHIFSVLCARRAEAKAGKNQAKLFQFEWNKKFRYHFLPQPSGVHQITLTNRVLARQVAMSRTPHHPTINLRWNHIESKYLHKAISSDTRTLTNNDKRRELHVNK